VTIFILFWKLKITTKIITLSNLLSSIPPPSRNYNWKSGIFLLQREVCPGRTASQCSAPRPTPTAHVFSQHHQRHTHRLLKQEWATAEGESETDLDSTNVQVTNPESTHNLDLTNFRYLKQRRSGKRKLISMKDFVILKATTKTYSRRYIILIILEFKS